MFKFENQSVLFEPKVGDELILNGNIGIYAPSGRYQFNVKHIEVFGEGALLKAFEELKKKLETEGLFSENIKKEIPAMPNSIAVITSETGAVLKDIITVLRRRSPSAKVTLVESHVQGKEAEKSISNAREFLIGQQLNVGKYYLKRNNPTAAMRRLKRIKKTTNVSSFLPEVSYRLIESFLLLGLSSEAMSEREYMRKKFSDSSWTVEAVSLIDKSGLD